MEYKVTNLTKKAIRQAWCLELLTGEQFVEYEEWKKSPGFLGDGDEDNARKLKLLAEGFKLQRWVTQKGNDLPHSVPGIIYENVKVGKNVTRVPKTEWMYELPAEGSLIVTGEQAKAFRRFENKKIVQKIKYGQVKPDEHEWGIVTIEEVKEEKKQEAKEKTGGYEEYVELQRRARELGLDITGNKQVLMERLQEYDSK